MVNPATSGAITLALSTTTSAGTSLDAAVADDPGTEPEARNPEPPNPRTPEPPTPRTPMHDRFDVPEPVTLMAGLDATINSIAALNSASVSLERVERSASGDIDVTWTSTDGGNLPTEGSIRVWFPSGFTFTGSSSDRTVSAYSSNTTLYPLIDGTLAIGAPNTDDYYVDISRTGGTAATVTGTQYTLRISNIGNPSTAGETSTFSIQIFGTTTPVDGNQLGQVYAGVTATIDASSALNSVSVAMEYSQRLT